jgi:hypothetical protein
MLARRPGTILCLSKIKSEHIRGAIRRGLGGKECALPSSQCAIGARPYPRPNACASHYTTRFENAHRTVLREVLYRHHAWFGRRVCIHGAVDKADQVVFRCTLEESQADHWLEVPAWMFDRTACPDPGLLAAQPYVSIEALAALSALLDLALKDQTPSAVLLSGASGASHDQNRGETHVTRDENFRERIPTQSTIAPAAPARSVRERPVERRHRRARMAGAAGGSAGSAHEPNDAADPRPCGDDSNAVREGG